jgi:hypothetical protein
MDFATNLNFQPSEIKATLHHQKSTRFYFSNLFTHSKAISNVILEYLKKIDSFTGHINFKELIHHFILNIIKGTKSKETQVPVSTLLTFTFEIYGEFIDFSKMDEITKFHKGVSRAITLDCLLESNKFDASQHLNFLKTTFDLFKNDEKLSSFSLKILSKAFNKIDSDLFKQFYQENMEASIDKESTKLNTILLLHTIKNSQKKFFKKTMDTKLKVKKNVPELLEKLQNGEIHHLWKFVFEEYSSAKESDRISEFWTQIKKSVENHKDLFFSMSIYALDEISVENYHLIMDNDFLENLKTFGLEGLDWKSNKKSKSQQKEKLNLIGRYLLQKCEESEEKKKKISEIFSKSKHSQFFQDNFWIHEQNASTENSESLLNALKDKESSESVLINHFKMIQPKKMMRKEKSEIIHFFKTLMPYALFNLESMEKYFKIADSVQTICSQKFFECLMEFYKINSDDYFEVIQEMSTFSQSFLKKTQLFDQTAGSTQVDLFKKLKSSYKKHEDSNINTFNRYMSTLQFLSMGSSILTPDTVSDLNECFEKIFINKDFSVMNLEVFVDCLLFNLSKCTNLRSPTGDLLSLFADKFDEKCWKSLLVIIDKSIEEIDELDDDSDEEEEDSEEEEEGEEEESEEEEEEEAPKKKQKIDSKEESESEEEEEKESEESEDDGSGYSSLDDEEMFKRDENIAAVFAAKREFLKQTNTVKNLESFFIYDVLTIVSNLFEKTKMPTEVVTFLVDYFLTKIQKSGELLIGSKKYEIIHRSCGFLPNILSKINESSAIPAEISLKCARNLFSMRLPPKKSQGDHSLDKLKSMKSEKMLVFLHLVLSSGNKEDVKKGKDFMEKSLFHVNSLDANTSTVLANILRKTPKFFELSSILKNCDLAKNAFKKQTLLGMVKVCIENESKLSSEITGKDIIIIMNLMKSLALSIKENESQKTQKGSNKIARTIILRFSQAMTIFLENHKQLGSVIKSIAAEFYDFISENPQIWTHQLQRIKFTNILGSFIGKAAVEVGKNKKRNKE